VARVSAGERGGYALGTGLSLGWGCRSGAAGVRRSYAFGFSPGLGRFRWRRRCRRPWRSCGEPSGVPGGVAAASDLRSFSRTEALSERSCGSRWLMRAKIVPCGLAVNGSERRVWFPRLRRVAGPRSDERHGARRRFGFVQPHQSCMSVSAFFPGRDLSGWPSSCCGHPRCRPPPRRSTTSFKLHQSCRSWDRGIGAEGNAWVCSCVRRRAVLQLLRESLWSAR